MMSAVSGEPLLRRVKQETDAPPQYSPPEPQPPHPQPLHPRTMPMMQPPEVRIKLVKLHVAEDTRRAIRPSALTYLQIYAPTSFHSIFYLLRGVIVVRGKDKAGQCQADGLPDGEPCYRLWTWDADPDKVLLYANILRMSSILSIDFGDINHLRNRNDLVPIRGEETRPSRSHFMIYQIFIYIMYRYFV